MWKNRPSPPIKERSRFNERLKGRGKNGRVQGVLRRNGAVGEWKKLIKGGVGIRWLDI